MWCISFPTTTASYDHKMKRCSNVIVQKKAKNRSNSCGGDCCICDEKQWPAAAAGEAAPVPEDVHDGCQQHQQQKHHEDHEVECRRD